MTNVTSIQSRTRENQARLTILPNCYIFIAIQSSSDPKQLINISMHRCKTHKGKGRIQTAHSGRTKNYRDFNHYWHRAPTQKLIIRNLTGHIGQWVHQIRYLDVWDQAAAGEVSGSESPLPLDNKDGPTKQSQSIYLYRQNQSCEISSVLWSTLESYLGRRLALKSLLFGWI